MSITTIVFIVILAFFTWRGYQKGFVGAITKVLSFLIAYPAAIFFTKPFATLLRTYINLDGLILFLVAGSTIFLVTSLLVTLILNGIARLVPTNEFTETGSKVGGAAFGIIFGSVIGLIAVYILNIVVKPGASVAHQISSTNQHEQNVSLDNEPSGAETDTDTEEEIIKKYVVAGGAPVGDSFIDSTAKKMVSTAASTAVNIITDDKTTARITKTLTQDPQAMLNHVQNMTNNGDFKQLLDKPDFQAELNRGDVTSLMQNKDFQALMQNPDMQAIVATSDKNDNSSEQATAEKMILAWQKVETLKNDPRVLNIVNDPAFQAQLNSPNKLPLLMNPKMRELSEIIFSGDTQPETVNRAANVSNVKQSKTRYVVEDITDGVKPAHENGDQKNSLNAKEESEEKTKEKVEQTLYRWTDKDGKVHYSDKPIKH